MTAENKNISEILNQSFSQYYKMKKEMNKEIKDLEKFKIFVNLILKEYEEAFLSNNYHNFQNIRKIKSILEDIEIKITVKNYEIEKLITKTAYLIN